MMCSREPTANTVVLQCRDGLVSVAPAVAAGDGSANANVKTLEERELELRLDASGVRAVPAPGEPDEAHYDSVNSFLLNTSPGFVKHFNASLARSLQQAVQEGDYKPRWAEVDDDE